MKILHTADLHFSINPDKLEEVIRCTDYLLSEAERDIPDVIILAGDTMDEADGKIRLDSETARAAIGFVQRAASIAPVVIIRGTKSHDRETPYIFKHLHTQFPVYVTSEIEQVALCSYPSEFKPLADVKDFTGVQAVFTLIPSIDKSFLMGQVDASIKEGNAQTRELLHDLFKGLGMVNQTITGVPCIAIIHGMVTGAQFSSGQTAIGEDLEFGVHDLQQLGCDYVALGHVHKMQSFPGNIFYSGSPGRLNFGETEEKGFLVVDFDGQAVKEVKFHPTPARRFALHSIEWGEGGKDAIMKEVEKCKAECQGADVRFRYTIPEENKHEIDRAELEKEFMAAGARKVKIECSIIPKTRQRAAGISRIQTLPEKVQMWGTTVGETIPEEVLKIAETIEGKDVEELIAEAMARVEGTRALPAAQAISIEERKERVRASMGRYFESQKPQPINHGPLFEEAAAA